MNNTVQSYSHILRNISFKQIKADRSNRLEQIKLLLEERLLDREAGHFMYLMSREKKNILQSLDSTHKTTGYSSESQRPNGSRDIDIRNSPYFSSGHKLSEKHFQRWRMVEARLERELHLSDLELLHKQQEQIALLNLLKDIGIIPSNAEIRLPNHTDMKQKFEKVIKQSVSSPISTTELQRKNHVPKLINITEKRNFPLLANKNSSINGENLFDSDNHIATEAMNKVKFVQQRPQTVGSRKIASNRLPVTNRLMSACQIEKRNDNRHLKIDTKFEENGKNGATVSSNKSQWYRDLLIEAPSSLNFINEPVKVKLAVSRSALKHQLSEMQNLYEYDVNRIAREQTERKKANQQHVLALTNAMRQVSNSEHVTS